MSVLETFKQLKAEGKKISTIHIWPFQKLGFLTFNFGVQYYADSKVYD